MQVVNKDNFNDFMDVILGIESSNTDWGQWIENHENYGAIGPSQIMYFNFPEQLKPAPLNFIIKDMSNDHDISLQKDSIDFQLIDFDIF